MKIVDESGIEMVDVHDIEDENERTKTMKQRIKEDRRKR
jgi:hypothetical protein